MFCLHLLWCEGNWQNIRNLTVVNAIKIYKTKTLFCLQMLWWEGDWQNIRYMTVVNAIKIYKTQTLLSTFVMLWVWLTEYQIPDSSQRHKNVQNTNFVLSAIVMVWVWLTDYQIPESSQCYKNLQQKKVSALVEWLRQMAHDREVQCSISQRVDFSPYVQWMSWWMSPWNDWPRIDFKTNFIIWSMGKVDDWH